MAQLTYDISVIIPFHNKSRLTADCLKSLSKFGPKFNEILLISNNSDISEIEKVEETIKKLNISCKLLEYNQAFNYQKICNWGVKQAISSYILFLNNDTVLTKQSIGLIERMYKKAQENNVGMVGCVLLYGDRSTIQHAGVFLRPGGLGDHIYVGKSYKAALKRDNFKEFPYDIITDRKVTAVTGAAQIISKTNFEKVKGFNEKFIVCGGDVDICIRLNKVGLQTWLIGEGYILHKESQSRPNLTVPYNDFYNSYFSYMSAFDLKCGDPFSSKITGKMK